MDFLAPELEEQFEDEGAEVCAIPKAAAKEKRKRWKASVLALGSNTEDGQSQRQPPHKWKRGALNPKQNRISKIEELANELHQEWERRHGHAPQESADPVEHEQPRSPSYSVSPIRLRSPHR